MQIQLFNYTKNTEQEYKFCSITPIKPKFQFFVKSQIQSLVCITNLEKNKSDKQNFFDSYNRFIRNQYRIQVTMHTSIFSRGLKPVLSRLPEINSIFQFNSICSARTNQDYEREGFKKKRHNQFYTGSPQRAMSSLLYTTCKESSTNSINCLHTINHPISTPRRNQEPC